MGQGRLDVSLGDFCAGPQARAYVQQVLDSGRLSYGPFSREFEQRWAALHDSAHAVFVNSGTSALQIALQALKERHGWPDGAEVIIPSVTFVATLNVCLHNRLVPVLADVDPRTYNIDPEQVERRLTPRTVALMPVHLAGLPADMRAITGIANRRGLRVVEDSCETTFASCHGRKASSWGDVGCHSTYMAHYVTTGVGGLAVTSDPDLAAVMRSLANHGRDGIYLSIDDDDRQGGPTMKEVIERRFNFVRLGHSFRCTELEAALGLAQLDRWRETVTARKAVAARYHNGLVALDGLLQRPTQPAGLEHVYMIFPLVAERKAGLVAALEEAGVETRDLLPLVRQPVYKGLFDFRPGDYPVADLLHEQGFYVGCHQYIQPAQADGVCELIREFFGRGR